MILRYLLLAGTPAAYQYKTSFALYSRFAPYSAELCLSILPFAIATIYNIKYIYGNAYYHVYNNSMQF